MNLKRFWTYYKPMVDHMNCGDFQAAARVLEDMALREGSCPRWRQLMVRFVAEGGKPPDHLHNMMMLGDNDEHLKEYVEARKYPRRRSLINKETNGVRSGVP